MTIRGFLPRILVNFGLWCLMFWFFQNVGWFFITESMPLWQVVLFSSLICVAIGTVIALIILGISSVLIALDSTAGIVAMAITAIILWPLLMFAELYLTGRFSGMFSMTNVWWQAYLIGLAFGFFQFKAPSTKTEKKTIHMSSVFDSKPLPRSETAYARPATKTPAFNPEAARWAGTMGARPASAAIPNRCSSCGRGVTRREDSCSHCGAENENYHPD